MTFALITFIFREATKCHTQMGPPQTDRRGRARQGQGDRRMARERWSFSPPRARYQRTGGQTVRAGQEQYTRGGRNVRKPDRLGYGQGS